MAVIKLCRPQMEIDTTSLIERVRVLEDKLEELAKNGIQVAAKESTAPAQGRNSSGEEVIKLEALNSSPKPSITDEPAWKKLYGKDFIRAFESGKLFD